MQLQHLESNFMSDISCLGGAIKAARPDPINWPKGALLISKRVLSIMYITLHGCQLRDIFGHKLGKMRISCSPVGTSPQLLENF